VSRAMPRTTRRRASSPISRTWHMVGGIRRSPRSATAA
jgi:hypothetical protein